MADNSVIDSSDNIREGHSSGNDGNLNLYNFPSQQFFDKLERLLDKPDDWHVKQEQKLDKKKVTNKSNEVEESKYNESGWNIDGIIDAIIDRVVQWNKDYLNLVNDYEEKTNKVISRQVVLAKLTTKEAIMMKTLEYFLDSVNREAAAEVLNFGNHHHVQMKVTSETILSLLFKFPNKDAEYLVKLLVEKGVQLVYLEQEDGFKRSSSQGSPSKRNLDRGNPSKRSLAIEELEALADGKGNDEEEEEEEKEAPEFQAKINGDDQMTKHERESSNFETAGYFNPEGLQRAVYLHQEYLGLQHAVETMFRSHDFSDEQELMIFECLHNGLVPSLEAGASIVNLIVAYDKQALYAKIFHHLKNADTSDRQQKMNSQILTSSMNTLIYSSIASYTSEDMILDGIKYSLNHDNIKFLDFLISNYDQETALNPFPIGSYLVNSLSQRLEKKQLFPYLDDKLRVLNKLCGMNTAQTTTMSQLITLFHKILDLEPRLSIFANVYNPLRLFVLMITMLNTLKNTVNNMDGMFDKLYERLEQYIVNIIDLCDSPGRLKNWLFDDFDGEMTVIDYIGRLYLLNILQHEKISKIVEQLWRGNIDPKKDTANILASIKTTRIGLCYREEHLTMEKFLPIISYNYPLAFPYWWIVFGCKLTKNIFTLKSGPTEELFTKRNKKKATDYSFTLYINAFREHYVSDLVLLVIMFIIYAVFCLLMVDKKVDLYNKYAEISVTTDATELTEKYRELEDIGKDWWYFYKGITFMNLALISLLCQDICIMLSLWVRNITFGALSKIFTYRMLMDLTVTVLAIYTLARYIDEYNVDFGEYRSEEQNYRRMRKTESDGYNTNGVFTFVILFLMVRIFMQMIYNGSYGTLIQIIFRMIEDCLQFLVVFTFTLISFAVCGCLLFYELEGFSDFSEAVKTLYESALGNFDFEMFAETESIHPTYGKVYLTVYLLISLILLLNFLIAILSDTYAKYIGVGTALMNAEIIKLRLINENHPHYLCLVKAPNLLLGWFALLMAPFVIFFKSRTLNRIILHIEYFPLITVASLFTIGQITVFIPIFYLTITILKIMNFKKY